MAVYEIFTKKRFIQELAAIRAGTFWCERAWLALYYVYARASSKTEQKIPRWGIFCVPAKIAGSSCEYVFNRFIWYISDLFGSGFYSLDSDGLILYNNILI
jgi:hypothetical protein